MTDKRYDKLDRDKFAIKHMTQKQKKIRTQSADKCN